MDDLGYGEDLLVQGLEDVNIGEVETETGPISLTHQDEDAGSLLLSSEQQTLLLSDSDSGSEELVLLTEATLDSVTLDDNLDIDKFEDARESLLVSETESVVTESVWGKHDKHIFVISEAGKPIYSLHGEDVHLVSLGGIMQALVSFVEDTGDSIRSIHTPDKTIVFLTKPPLILVAVGNQSVSQLTVQLTYIHNQIISVLTATQINRIFSQRRNYDLRRMLSGSERLMTSLSNSMDTDPSYFLSSVRCLTLPPSVRDTISESIIKFASKVPDMVFGILIADNQLVTLVRMKKYYIHPADLHLIFNLINSSESFKHSESWTPICLPKFDPTGFLHAHVSYINDSCPACLVLLTVDRNAFFTLSAARAKIVDRMERHGSIPAILSALKDSHYTTQSINIPEVRHFLYKSRTSAQFTSPEFSPCYQLDSERARLYKVYLSLQNRFHSVSRPLKLSHFSTDNEIVLGWLTQAFELYAVFSPTTSKLAVITAVNKILRWIKKEEDKMFILTAPTF